MSGNNLSGITVVEEQTLLDLHEMSGTCAVKGKLLREIIDELLTLRRAHAGRSSARFSIS